MQYVKKKGNFWIKTSERTGWWIAGKKDALFVITNGFVCQYVRKELIKDETSPPPTQPKNEEASLNQTTQIQQQKRKRGRPPAPQQTCPKCSAPGIVIERLVKSNIYRCIRHKKNGKIKECVIQNVSKSFTSFH